MDLGALEDVQGLVHLGLGFRGSGARSYEVQGLGFEFRSLGVLGLEFKGLGDFGF